VSQRSTSDWFELRVGKLKVARAKKSLDLRGRDTKNLYQLYHPRLVQICPSAKIRRFSIFSIIITMALWLHPETFTDHLSRIQRDALVPFCVESLSYSYVYDR